MKMGVWGLGGGKNAIWHSSETACGFDFISKSPFPHKNHHNISIALASVFQNTSTEARSNRSAGE